MLREYSYLCVRTQILALGNNSVVCLDREEAVWCFSAVHGLGQTLWFPAVSE